MSKFFSIIWIDCIRIFDLLSSIKKNIYKTTTDNTLITISYDIFILNMISCGAFCIKNFVSEDCEKNVLDINIFNFIKKI